MDTFWKLYWGCALAKQGRKIKKEGVVFREVYPFPEGGKGKSQKNSRVTRNKFRSEHKELRPLESGLWEEVFSSTF
jgi:hypothetical protein